MRILDLFCNAGGATAGYYRAFPGALIVGVDIVPQPHYVGDEFYQADWLEFLSAHLTGWDLIHASPPCQADSSMTACRPGLAATYPRLIGKVREWLTDSGCPYVIENVPGSDVRPDAVLCGQMFGLELYRHRLFECSFPVSAPPHPHHLISASRAGHWVPGTIMSVAGHVSPIAKACEVMGIDWMSRDELVEAIPPAYAQWIGEQFRDAR